MAIRTNNAMIFRGSAEDIERFLSSGKRNDEGQYTLNSWVTMPAELGECGTSVMPENNKGAYDWRMEHWGVTTDSVMHVEGRTDVTVTLRCVSQWGAPVSFVDNVLKDHPRMEVLFLSHFEGHANDATIRYGEKVFGAEWEHDVTQQVNDRIADMTTKVLDIIGGDRDAMCEEWETYQIMDRYDITVLGPMALRGDAAGMAEEFRRYLREN